MNKIERVVEILIDDVSQDLKHLEEMKKVYETFNWYDEDMKNSHLMNMKTFASYLDKKIHLLGILIEED